MVTGDALSQENHQQVATEAIEVRLLGSMKNLFSADDRFLPMVAKSILAIVGFFEYTNILFD